MKRLELLILLIGLVILGSCQNVSDAVGNISDMKLPPLDAGLSGDTTASELVEGDCPTVEIVGELGALSEFIDIKRKRPENLVSRVDLAQARSACAYTARSVTVDLRLAFQGILGPRARQANTDRPFFSYPYFIAVTSPSGEILAKEVFSATLNYDNTENSTVYYEDLRQIIPVTGRSNGSRHKILIGFQLTQDQLDYNRAIRIKSKPKAVIKAPAAAGAETGPGQAVPAPVKREPMAAPARLTPQVH